MENLREELTCFICLDYFTSPVTTECGHSFCLVCLLRSWEEHSTPLSCPECWRALESPHFQPNERLGRLAGIGKQLRSQVLQSEGGQGSSGRMLAVAKAFSDEQQGVNAFSTQCHGINRLYPSSEAEERHKVRLAAQYKSQNTNHVPSLMPIIFSIGDNHGSWSPGTRPQTWRGSCFTPCVWSRSSYFYWSSSLHNPVLCSFATENLFLLQEKLQEILNLLRKKKKETQVVLSHEKERVTLCKVSICLTFGSRICSMRETKGIPSEIPGEKDQIFQSLSYNMQCLYFGLCTSACPPGNPKSHFKQFPHPQACLFSFLLDTPIQLGGYLYYGSDDNYLKLQVTDNRGSKINKKE